MTADLIAFPNRRTERERQRTHIAVEMIWDCIKAVIKVTPALREDEPLHADPAALQALAVEFGGVAKRIERALAKGGAS